MIYLANKYATMIIVAYLFSSIFIKTNNILDHDKEYVWRLN